jgi:transposase InsO family protein
LKLRYGFIEQVEAEFPVSQLCKLLKVSRSAYYEWKAGRTHQPSGQQQEQQAKVEKAFWLHRRRYGSRRLVSELQQMDLQIGRKKVRRLMKIQGLIAIQPRCFVPRTTDSRHGKRVSPNLLLDRLLPTEPNRIWVGDITYIALVNGRWAYLATWMDLFSRVMVGWQLDHTMEEALIIHALSKALEWREPAAGLIIHSDRGGQYVGNQFRKLLDKHGCLQSMSRADDAYDNAFAESFFSRLKTELLEEGAFLSLEDARTELFEFIEMYYNPIRRHSALGYKSPLNFEKHYYQNHSLNLQ